MYVNGTILYKAMIAAGVSLLLCSIYGTWKWIVRKMDTHNVMGECKYCGIKLKRKDEIFTCPVCSSTCHLKCYQTHNGCANMCEENCEAKPWIKP